MLRFWTNIFCLTKEDWKYCSICRNTQPKDCPGCKSEQIICS